MRSLLLALLWCWIAWSPLATAGNPKVEMAYFLDTHSNLGIEDLLDASTTTYFHALEQPTLVVGYSRYPLWLKITLPANDSAYNTLQLDGFLLSQIDVYQSIDGQPPQHPHIQHQHRQHQHRQHPQLFSNRFAITPVASTLWVRVSANSAMHLSTSLSSTSLSGTATDHNTAHDFSLLVFALTLSMGLVGVILHTQSQQTMQQPLQQNRLSLVSLQGLLLVLSGINLPMISALGFNSNALTAALLLTFLLHVSDATQAQPWWSVRNLRIVRSIMAVLLIACLWSAPLSLTLLLLVCLLSYALWAPFAHIHVSRHTFKSSLKLITADALFWLICIGISSLQTGWWPYPQHSELIWCISLILLSISLVFLQLRAFINEHRTASLLANDALQPRPEREVFKNLAPQPIIASPTLLPRAKLGMRQEDEEDRLHDHLSIIQQESPASHLIAQEHTANLESQAFNLRVVGHELLQELESLAYAQQTPLLFAIKPGTHTHLIGAAEGLMTLLQLLTKHSLQLSPAPSISSPVGAISVRIEDEGIENTGIENEGIRDESISDINNSEQQYPVLLKCHLRDSSCLSEEKILLLNTPVKHWTDQQLAQLQLDYPHLLAAKQLIEKLQGQLLLYAEGAATTCYTLTLPMQTAQAHQPEPPKSFLTLKDKKILLMTYDGEYGMTMAEQAGGQDIPLSLALSISQARRNLQYSHQTDAQFDLLVFDCSHAEETLQAFISEIHSTLPGYVTTPLLLLHHINQTLPPDNRHQHAHKSSAFAQLGALINSLLSNPAFSR
jgi:hypothetical protein